MLANSIDQNMSVAMQATVAAEKPMPLPRIRTDLQFLLKSEGSMVYDPLLHRYFRLDRMSFSVLRALSEISDIKHATAQDLLQKAQDITGSTIDAATIKTVFEGAEKNGFFETKSGDGWKATFAAFEKTQLSGWKWLLHNYISFRIPVLRPDALLERADKILRVIFSPITAVVIGLLAVVTLYLVSRQWTEFSSAIRGLAEAPMLLGLGVTILVVKLWHEVGHGHFARRYGCRVPSAGILVILGAPLFYTDVTDAWRLKDRRQRMMIAAAGIMAEAILAVLALTVWVFLKDGLARNIAFFVASGSLITTLLINLSPFMRFDGYFLLSDGLRIPNLHDRAFESMKWYLRHIVLGFQDPVPQQLQDLRIGWLALFGFGTALYRLSLFLGIAIFVYYTFFKLVGLMLFAVEIAWFILMPLNKEFKVWQQRSHDICWFGAGGRTILLALFGLILLFAPLSKSVSMKAVLEPAEIARAHPVAPAFIEKIHVSQGDRVKKGDLLFSLVSPQLSYQMTTIDLRLTLTRARLARSAADVNERASINVLIEEERSLITQRDGLMAEITALHVKAPIAGVILEIDREIHAGRTVATKDRLALIGSETGQSARSFAGSESVERLTSSASAKFIAENPQASKLHMNLVRIAAAPSITVEPQALASLFGGDVPSTPDRQGKNVASIAAYNLVFNSDGAPQAMAIRGTIHVAAASESLGFRALKRAVSVIIRESGV